MTDRVRILTVLLEDDVREDDAGDLVKAIAGFRHVVDVKVGPPVDVNDWAVRSEFRIRFGRQIMDWVLDSQEGGGA